MASLAGCLEVARCSRTARPGPVMHMLPWSDTTDPTMGPGAGPLFVALVPLIRLATGNKYMCVELSASLPLLMVLASPYRIDTPNPTSPSSHSTLQPLVFQFKYQYHHQSTYTCTFAAAQDGLPP